jgi:hypothetical protein
MHNHLPEIHAKTAATLVPVNACTNHLFIIKKTSIMKKLFSVLLIMAACSAAQAQNKASDVAKFNTETIRMGKLKQNVPATATFVVTNIGNQPLVLEKPIPSCGCTAADYTKTPIAPGASGFVKATYNAAAPGSFTKTVSVKFTGLTDVTALSISGEVEPAKQ